ncbi:MAG: Uma2 family endonuclease [Acidobacteria bacterium]|nr:Uma2 family endonuclease [Acidobacteriota bacterium]
MIKMILETPGTLLCDKTRMSLPESAGYEILNGMACPMPFADTKHQRIAIKLTAFLYENLERKNRGVVMGAPSSVMLSSWDIVRPDVFFVRKNREGIVGDHIVLGPPDLVVEIINNDSWERDMKEKRKIYAEAGIQEYWIVNPGAEAIEQLVWCELGYIAIGIYPKGKHLSPAFIPNLRLPVSKVFA